MPTPNAFGARGSLGPGLPDLYRLETLATSGIALGVDLGRAPITLRILLENALRHAGGGIVREADVAALAAWRSAFSSRILRVTGARPRSVPSGTAPSARASSRYRSGRPAPRDVRAPKALGVDTV